MFNHPSESACLQRWYRDQAIAYWLEQAMQDGKASLSDEAALEFLDRFAEPLSLVGPTGAPNLARLAVLPTSALYQVAKIDHPWLVEMSSAAKAVLNKQENIVPGRGSMYFNAKLISNRLRSGTHTPMQILRMLKSALGFQLPEAESRNELERLLQSFIDEFSAPSSAFPRVIEALEPLSKALVSWPKWRLVENSIMHSLFVWPMCVLSGREQFGSTLPLHVRLYVPKPTDTFPEPMAKVDNGNGQAVTTGPICESANRALQCALGLWENEFSNWAHGYHFQVRNAQATIDLTHADMIRRECGFGGALSIEGRSLEAYLFLVFLGKLLGDDSYGAVSATGMIGDYRYGGKPGDAVVEQVNGELAKMDRLSLSPDIDRLLFPDRSINEEMIKKEIPAHISLHFGEYLSDFAERVFPNSFAKNRFIRCADLRMAYRGDLVHHEPSDDVVQRLREQIERSDGTVIQFPPGTKGADVAHAIFKMNQKAVEYAEEAKAYEGNAKPPHFLQSSVFIRATEYETSDRFWQVVWEAITGKVRLDLPLPGGARRRSMGWGGFSNSIAWGEPATILSEKLNRNTATYWEPNRVPDKIVIVGTKHLSRTVLHCPRGPFQRLQLNSLLKGLRHNLGQIKPDYVVDQIGRARLLLVADESIPVRPQIRLNRLPEAVQEVCQSLHVFPNGFSFDTAKSALGLDYWDCRSVLSTLLMQKVDDVALVSHEPKTDTYLFNFEFITTEQATTHMARKLYRGGVALAGIAARTSIEEPGSSSVVSDYRQMLLPANVHDAEYLLSRARDSLKASDVKDQRLYQAIMSAKQTLARYGEPFSWSHVRHIAKGRSGDGTDIALREAALDHLDRWNSPCHPIESTYVAMILWNEYWSVPPNSSDAEERKVNLFTQMESVLDRAEADAASLRPRPGRKVKFDEEKASLFFLGSTMASLLISKEPSRSYIARSLAGDDLGDIFSKMLPHYFRMAEENVDSARDNNSLEWFVYRGDFEMNPKKALLIYACAISNELSGKDLLGLDEAWRFVDPVIKYLGCARALNFKFIHPVVVNRVVAWEPSQLGFIWRSPQTSGGLVDDIAKRRWRDGRFQLLDVLCEYEIQTATASTNLNAANEAYRRAAKHASDCKGLNLRYAGDPVIRALLRYVGSTVKLGEPLMPEIENFLQRSWNDFATRLEDHNPVQPRERPARRGWKLEIDGKKELLARMKSS